MGRRATSIQLLYDPDALETGNTIGIGKVLQTYEVFRVLGDNNVCQIASFAVVKIGLGLRELGWTV
jgi:hypothetical protein